MSRLISVVVAGLLLGSSMLSEAAVVTFNDRALWRAAAGGGTGDLSENFNGFVTDTSFANVSVVAGFLTFSSPLGASAFHYIDASPFGTPGALDDTSYAVLRASDGVFSTQVDFGPLAAIGFDYINFNITGALDLTTSLGENLTVPDSSDGDFFGIVYTAGEAITSLLFPGSNGLNLAYSSDNWEAYSATPAVPEPTTLLLLGFGLAGLGFARKRLH